MVKKVYQKTKYPNILIYETKKGIRYRIRKNLSIKGTQTIVDESGFKNLASAKARLREIEEQIDKNEAGYIRNKKITVNEYYQEYSKRKTLQQVWSADTRYSNDSLMNVHIKPIFGHIPLSKIQRTDYELFIAEKLKKLRKRSVQSIHVTFMAMLNDAVYNGIIERNRLMRVFIGNSSKSAKNKQLSLTDYQKWMDTAEKILNKYEFSIIYLSVFGLRRGEICGLKQAVISHDDQLSLATIHVVDTRTSKTASTGKGGTKTASSNRHIILDQKGTQAINYVIKEAQEIKKDFGKILHQNEFLFINPANGKPYHPTQINRLFERVSVACDIKVSPHMMRHFFATQAVIAGVSVEHAAAYLGHRNKTMTEYYTHIRNETAPNVINMVSERLSKSK
jgi:integrase